MRLRVVTHVPSFKVGDGAHLADELETFSLVLSCHQCFRPIESAADASLVFRADRAWSDEGDAPTLAHDACLDQHLRSRFRYRDRGIVRIRPSAEMLGPLIAALEVSTEARGTGIRDSGRT